ncbi:hypothetical protein [Actinomadura violacea]|uniref:Uncharacterized protein n=1 Tax=Actinomadura violacea TaxID=2819934 RepID=A0ABS3SAI5_9ACTN|nr:hypothetical protein [Actinomadura violacea]MBO2465768.1 hypothetical protein [Actinomadura violacea]
MISFRSAAILVIAALVGAAAGVLTYLQARSLSHALLAGGSVIGGTAGLLNQVLITPVQPNSTHDGSAQGVSAAEDQEP